MAIDREQLHADNEGDEAEDECHRQDHAIDTPRGAVRPDAGHGDPILPSPGSYARASEADRSTGSNASHALL